MENVKGIFWGCSTFESPAQHFLLPLKTKFITKLICFSLFYVKKRKKQDYVTNNREIRTYGEPLHPSGYISKKLLPTWPLFILMSNDSDTLTPQGHFS